MSATEPGVCTTMVDVQASPLMVALSLSRVGVTGVEKVIRLRHTAPPTHTSLQAWLAGAP